MDLWMDVNFRQRLNLPVKLNLIKFKFTGI